MANYPNFVFQVTNWHQPADKRSGCHLVVFKFALGVLVPIFTTVLSVASLTPVTYADL